jgi:hypothetical protein
MQRLNGVWTGNAWPVVVCAYKQGESIDAIALDQVMLRQGETRFVLWIPEETKYQIRVFNRLGSLNSRLNSADMSFSVSLEN